MPGRSVPGRLWLCDPSSGGRRGVVADPGAGPCGGVAGGRGGAGGCAAAAGDVVPALGGAACGACAGARALCRSFRSGAGMRSKPSLLLVRGAARCGARHARHGRALTADAAGCGDAGAADAGACGVPWRHRRRAADRACACGGGLVPAACAGRAWVKARPAAAMRRRQPCGAARSGGAWPSKKDLAARKRFGGARSRGGWSAAAVDLTRTVGWFTSLYPVRLDPGLLDLEDALSGGAALGRALKTHQGAAARGARQGAWLWAVALSQRRDGAASLPGCRRRSLASTIWGGLRPAALARTGRRQICRPAGGAGEARLRRRRSGDAACACRSRSTR